MDFALTPEQQTFRQEIRAFLASEVPPSATTEDGWIVGFSREFSRKLGERGWIGLTWPKKYGGQERSYLDRVVLTEELLRAGIDPLRYGHEHGDAEIAPALAAEARQTPAPQAEHLAALDRWGPCPLHRRTFAGVWRQGELFVLEKDD